MPPAFEIYEKNFASILGNNPQLHLLTTGHTATEGPVYLSAHDGTGGFLLFTENRKDCIHVLRWHGLDPFRCFSELSYSHPAIFRSPSGVPNGMAKDLKGRLLVTEVAGHRISITEASGEIQTLVDTFAGKKLNSPNDLVVKSDGTIWFTDPQYGALQFHQFAELPSAVYRFDPANLEITKVIEDLEMPNGLAFSVNEKILYVSDSAAIQSRGTYYAQKAHHVFAYTMATDGRPKNRRIFAEINPGFPDGICIDQEDNVYVAAGDGVHIFSVSGQLIGKILLPKRVNNLTFGGEENNILFICATDSVWGMHLHVKGT